MAQNVYECMFIFDSNRYARDPNKLAGRIPEIIQSLDGELLVSRLWNEQKLAYPIRGQRKGTYWLTFFRMESSRLGEFERACQLSDGILRNLTLAVEPRLVDALVAHARGEAVDAPETVDTPAAVDTPEAAVAEATDQENAGTPTEEATEEATSEESAPAEQAME